MYSFQYIYCRFTNQSIILFDTAATKPIILKLISLAEQIERPAIIGIRENITNKLAFSPENRN